MISSFGSEQEDRYVSNYKQMCQCFLLKFTLFDEVSRNIKKINLKIKGMQTDSILEPNFITEHIVTMLGYIKVIQIQKMSNYSYCFLKLHYFIIFCSFYQCFKKFLMTYNISKKMRKIQMQDKTKRYSKISIALKSYFFKLIYIKELTIKDSAKVCRLNYSTAKAIIRDLTQKQKAYIRRQIEKVKLGENSSEQITLRHSNYRETELYNEQKSSQRIDERTQNSSQNTPIRNNHKICVTSTVGYDFLECSSHKVKIQESND